MTVLTITLLFMILLFGRYSYSNGNKLIPSQVTHFYGYLILYVITCFRFMVGFDYPAYYIRFGDLQGASYFEPIPKFFYYLSYKLGSPVFLFTFFSFFTLTFVFLGIKKQSAHYYESFIVFITIFYLESLNIIRQWLAVAIMFYAFRFVRERKLIPYILFILLASIAHSSALVCLPIFFIYNYIPFFLVLVSSGVFIIFSEKIISTIMGISFLGLAKYSVYLRSVVSNGSQKVVYFFYILIFISLIIYYMTGKNPTIRKEISVILVGLLFPKLLGPQMGIRMALYYNTGYIILIPMLFDHIKVTYIKRHCFLIPFYFYYIIYLLTDLHNSSAFSPYRFYFFESISKGIK